MKYNDSIVVGFSAVCLSAGKFFLNDQIRGVSMAEVTLTDLVKTYPGAGKNPPIQAVKTINLEIKDQEFMVLVGPSGCGKSTVLRMIAGLEEVTSGEVTIGDKMVNELLPKDRDIAMVFQNYALYPHMTVFDNMAFGLKLGKVPKEEIRERVENAAEILNIHDLLTRRPKALSGGQRQRVAVGRAIVRNPKVFLFDEPLSNLDAKMRISMRTEISRLHARLGATMIFVTHDQVEAMTMGDRICVMKDGVIMQVAEPLELYNHPANMFVASFIGSPPMNFIDGILARIGGQLVFQEKNVQGKGLSFELTKQMQAKCASFVGKDVVLGIRPEDIADAMTEELTLDSACGEAVVDVTEPMGSETFLHLHSGGHSFISKMAPGERHQVGDKINLLFNIEKSHLFDPETEAVL